jgi:hypothetical protein
MRDRPFSRPLPAWVNTIRGITRMFIHAYNGIRTHDVRVRAITDSPCISPKCHFLMGKVTISRQYGAHGTFAARTFIAKQNLSHVTSDSFLYNLSERGMRCIIKLGCTGMCYHVISWERRFEASCCPYFQVRKYDSL